jgi:hypothetical protein
VTAVPWFPTAEEELLLRAALGRGAEVEKAWRAWRAQVALDDVEMASFRLLPLAWVNLVEHGVQDPDLGRLTGIYRHAWARSQFQHRTLVDVLRTLHSAGIETMLLKGAALVQSVYPSPATRPMDDLDVLVPQSSARAAQTALAEAGWAEKFPGKIPASQRALGHAVHLVRGDAEELDLHWRALLLSRVEGGDDFWLGGEPIEVEGIPTQLPSPTSLLLHMLVRASHGAEKAPLRWVPDTVLLARRCEIDWEALVERAAARRVTLYARVGLQYLHQTFGAAPAPAVAALEQLPVRRHERAEFERRVAQAQRTGLAFHVGHYRHLTDGMPAWRRATGFPAYLRDWWGLPSVWRVPAESIRRLRVELRGRPATVRADRPDRVI